jgi:hypothetical protein
MLSETIIRFRGYVADRASSAMREPEAPIG